MKLRSRLLVVAGLAAGTVGLALVLGRPRRGSAPATTPRAARRRPPRPPPQGRPRDVREHPGPELRQPEPGHPVGRVPQEPGRRQGPRPGQPGQVESDARQPGLRRADRRRRQGVRRHQQREPAEQARPRPRPTDDDRRPAARQGHPDVLRREDRQVPLAGGPRQAAERAGQRLAEGGHLLDARPSRATASTTSATGATVVCLDANGFADGNHGVQDEKYKDDDRRGHHLGVRHDRRS